MAHFILEYSANLKADQLNLDGLFAALTESAVTSNIFPLAGIRCRAHKCKDFLVAGETKTFAFVHLNFRIGAGRTEEQKAQVAKTLFDILSHHLSAIFTSQGLAISFELSELAEHKFNQNNLRDYLVSSAS